MTEAVHAGPSRFRRILHVMIEEFRLVIPPTLFFALSFNLLVLSMNLLLSEYLLHFGSFLLATAAALVVGKAVLVADKMPFLRRFDTAPLIRPILFKTLVYWVFVFIARLLEAVAHYVIETGGFAGWIAFMLERFSWHRFAFIQLWIFVLFLIYVTAVEVNALFGGDRLARIFFKRRSGH